LKVPNVAASSKLVDHMLSGKLNVVHLSGWHRSINGSVHVRAIGV
jgi:hypothetical protein